MSEERFGGVPASAKVSVYRLCPFCGDKGKEKTMLVCSVEELNGHLSSNPLMTIRKTKYDKHGQKYEDRFCQCGCSCRINVKYLADGVTCHVTQTGIPPDHFDVDKNPQIATKTRK
jgi:hypothetical protein